jgi:hypothetical protein
MSPQPAGARDPRFVDAILDWRWTGFLARLALVGAYLLGGIVKLTDFPAAVAEQAHFGMNPPAVWAMLTIAVELTGPILILTGRFVWLGAGMLDGTGKTGIDLYYLGYRNRDAVFEQGEGREVRHTLGVRSFGRASDWHWNVEGMLQFGRFDGMPIHAWSVGTELGHAFPGVPLKPDIVTRFNIVSGDRKSSDHALQSFNALFPKGKYFGELSPVGPCNIVNGHLGATFDLGRGWGFGMAGMACWRQSLGDGIYQIPGSLLRSGAGSRARFIGKQVEATVSWLVAPELELSASVSAFQPGRFIRETGPANTIHMLGLESNFRF